jgi:hypothetical protein
VPDTQAPFLGEFTVPGVGPFRIIAVATDNFGNVGAGTVNLEGFDQPSGGSTFVNITHPVGGGIGGGVNDFSTPSEVYFNASVILPAVPPGTPPVTVDSIQFLLDGQVVGQFPGGDVTRLGNTYGLYWRPSAEGFYTLNAQVTDSRGITVVSPPQRFDIGELQEPLPTIELLGLPASTIRQGSTIYLQAKVNGGLTPVDGVDFYANQVYLGSVNLGFAADNADDLALFAWTPTDDVTYQISARAQQVSSWDNSVISGTLPLTVLGPPSGLEPVVTLLQAPISERLYVTGSQIFLNATAEAQGAATIVPASVAFFYRGENKVGASSGILSGTNSVYSAKVPVASDSLSNFVYASAQDSLDNVGNSTFSEVISAAPRTPFPVAREKRTSTSLAAAPMEGGALITVWLAALAAVTVVNLEAARKSRTEPALSEVALTYCMRMRSRPTDGTTAWLRTVPALPVKLNGVMAWIRV